MADLQHPLKHYQKQGLEQMLRRRDEKVEGLEGELAEATLHAEEGEAYREEVRRLQLKMADMKRQLEHTKEKMKKKEAAAAESEEHLESDPDIPIIRLKNDAGHFTNEAKILIMTLVGECEVPAHHCGIVIQNVIHQVCGARVPDTDPAISNDIDDVLVFEETKNRQY